MDGSDFQLIIKPLTDHELVSLETNFPIDATSGHHKKRFDRQTRNEGLYLIAWHQNIPIGHFFLQWSGPSDDVVIKHIDISKAAYLGAGRTHENYRRRGVATRLIQEAEKLAKENGCTTIGMVVGSDDNPDARRLYEKLGYIDWGKGDFTTSWEYKDKKGNIGIESEVVTYLQKPLD